MIDSTFFNRDTQKVAQDLLGKVLCVRYHDQWLCAQIIETEAYYLNDKGSHASLGFTEKRKALFMPPGTIYMYYARGGDSLNVSTEGDGNAVLIKSAYPYLKDANDDMLEIMKTLNPQKNNASSRPIKKLCSGQTLLCKALGLKVSEWDQQQFDSKEFYVDDVAYFPEKIIQTRPSCI